MSPAERYWKSMYELIVHGYLYEIHSQRSAKIDLVVKASLALTSTSSLGLWAALKAYPGIWASIIVVTQVITAVSKYFPFSKRLKACGTCSHSYNEIQIWAEAKWADIVDGELNNAQINKARTELKTKIAKAEKASFPFEGLPSNDKFMESAVELTHQYMDTHFKD